MCAFTHIPSPNSYSEFFILEYRKRIGLFEPSVPGDGLIIYRIDPYENGNASGPPDEVYLFRPGGDMNNNGNVNQAHFSADVGRTEFNDNTNPAGFLQDGSPGGIFISEIGFLCRFKVLRFFNESRPSIFIILSLPPK